MFTNEFKNEARRKAAFVGGDWMYEDETDTTEEKEEEA